MRFAQNVQTEGDGGTCGICNAIALTAPVRNFCRQRHVAPRVRYQSSWRNQVRICDERTIGTIFELQRHDGSWKRGEFDLFDPDCDENLFKG